jgi:thiol-disulfide isomerase/thioredoxin
MSEKSVILFTSETCGPCKRVKDCFNVLAARPGRPSNWNWIIMAVEQTPQSVSVYGVKGVPTIMMVIDKQVKIQVPMRYVQNLHDLEVYIDGSCMQLDEKEKHEK